MGLSCMGMYAGMSVCERVSVSVCLSYSGNKRVYLPLFKYLHCVCVCILFVVGACV